METFHAKDMMGRQVLVPKNPKRIISLVPSQTELLYDLGVGEQVVGQTLFCIHPREAHQYKTRVGGTKNYKFEVIRELQPDLIIGNKEENDEQGINTLAEEFPVWMSDIYGLQDALQMIKSIGALVNKLEKATAIANQIDTQFSSFTHSAKPQKVLYLIWRKPYMAAGNHTFINDMLKHLNLVNVCNSKDARYPEINFDNLTNVPDVILLSSEPYPFKQQHINEIATYFPASKILLVDGELFSWYGSRLLHSTSYFNYLLQQIHS